MVREKGFTHGEVHPQRKRRKLTKQLEGLPAGAEREMLLKLLAEEKAKGSKPVKPIGC
jgi:hypothetical protein